MINKHIKYRQAELNKLKLAVVKGDNIYIKEGFSDSGNIYKFMFTIIGALAEM